MAKTISFAIIHFSVAFSVGYLLTGSVLFGSVMAMVEPAINTVAFHFHEKVWNHWQQSQSADQYQAPASSEHQADSTATCNPV